MNGTISSPTASIASCCGLVSVSQTLFDTMIGSRMKKKLRLPGVVRCFDVSCSLNDKKLLELVQAASITPVDMPT